MPTRTRLKLNNPVTFRFQSWAYDGNNETAHYDSGPVAGRYLEYHGMTDVLSGSPAERRQDHPCSHLTVIYHPVECGVDYYSSADHKWHGRFEYSGSSLIFESHGVTGLTVPQPALPVGWLDSCHEKFLTAIDEVIASRGLETLNFLWELRDFRHAFQVLLPSVSTLRTKLADMTLLVNFAIDPFVRDVKAMVGLLEAVQSRIDWLKDHVGEPMVIRMAASSTVDTTAIPPTADAWTDYVRVGQAEVRYHAQATVTYDLTRLDIDLLRGDMIRRRLGLDKPYKNLWDSLPWTFILDWFLRVGDLIGRLEDYTKLPVHVIECCWSLKQTWGLQHEVWAPQLLNPGTYGVRGNAKCISYVRRVGLPAKVPFIQAGSPGLQQLALSLALYQSRTAYRGSRLRGDVSTYNVG